MHGRSMAKYPTDLMPSEHRQHKTNGETMTLMSVTFVYPLFGLLVLRMHEETSKLHSMHSMHVRIRALTLKSECPM